MTSPAAQRTGGHRRVATRETTGDPATRRGAGDPERRAEWTTVLRYGHLQSAPVMVGAAYTQGAGTAYTPCSTVTLLTPILAPPRWLTASPTTRNCVCWVRADQDIATCSPFLSRTTREIQSAVHMPEVTCPELRERCRAVC